MSSGIWAAGWLAAAAAMGAGAAPGLVRFPAPWTSPYRVDPAYPHHLVNAEGEHLFLLCKTAWAYFGCQDPAGFLDRARSQGVNVIRVALEGTPYRDSLGLDLWPWGGTRERPDFASFSAAYWDRVEERVRLAGEKGIGLDLVLYVSLRPSEKDVGVQRRYWQEALRRLGKYANLLTWEIHNEHTANEAFQDAAGAFLARNDPFGRPVCTSDGTTDDAVWPHKPWMGLAIVHTCTGSDRPLDAWYQCVARNTRAHGKPAFCNESGREKRHRNDDPVHRRKQAWIWCLSGAYWTWHSWDGCEGINDRQYRAPGEEFVRPLADFCRALPFWRMDPNHTAVRSGSPGLITACLSEPGRDTVAAYVCTPESGRRVDAAALALHLPAGHYRVDVVDPASLKVIQEREEDAAGIWKGIRLKLPAFTDDVLLRVRKSRAGAPAAMPGTG